jgi:hypothetical protein
MTTKNIRTSAAILASFYASSRLSDQSRNGALTLNAASAAGMLLHICPGPKSALDAARRMPDDPIWRQVALYLEGLIVEERRDTEPAMAMAGSVGR